MKNELEDNKELVLFENSKIRRQEFNDEWHYSIVDIISILTEQTDFQKSRKYWNKLKQRLIEEEASETVTKCHQLKMIAADGKMRKTDCANRETIFRIIQSVPSPNAEPFKLWFARLAEERIQEINDPSLAIERARQTYLKNGFDATFKRFNINQGGVTLTPLNLENEDGYLPTSYEIEQIQNLPIKVIGIAKRRISDID